MPNSWARQFRLDHATDEDDLTINDVIAYFTEVQQQQQLSLRVPAQMRGGGRTGLPRNQERQQRLILQQQFRARRDNQPQSRARRDNQLYHPLWRDNNSQYRPSW